MITDIQTLIRALGGADNIDSLEPCTTRLRVELLHPEKVDRALLRSAGIHGASIIGGVVHVVVGPNADSICTDMVEVLESLAASPQTIVETGSTTGTISNGMDH